MELAEIVVPNRSNIYLERGSEGVARMARRLQRCATYVGQEESTQIDSELLQLYTLDQLMELAGLSVAHVVHFIVSSGNKSARQSARIAILAGPGNNGGDALVAARHLASFGHAVTAYAPRVPARLAHLLRQAAALGVGIVGALQDLALYDAVVDGVFGFGACGDPRPPFDEAVQAMAGLDNVISVDVPSGWPVDGQSIPPNAITPCAIVSLTAPKLCLQGLAQSATVVPRHFLAGRFVPRDISVAHKLDRNPAFDGSSLFVETLL